MPEEPDLGFGGPSPQDIANGTAILASALVREAEALSATAAAMRASAEGFPGEPYARGREMVLANAWHAAVLAGALTLTARLLLHSIGDARRAARDAAAGLARGELSGRVLLGHLRAAALAPVTDDGAARIAASMVAESFAAEFEPAWRAAPDGQGN